VIDDPNPDVPCVVLPRRGATAEQRRALSRALASWGEREAGLLRFIDEAALRDLLRGEGDEQLLVFCVVRRGPDCRGRAIASLRAAVPADLVEDVLIDGRSWAQPD
jgi:hypothetical protein